MNDGTTTTTEIDNVISLVSNRDDIDNDIRLLEKEVAVLWEDGNIDRYTCIHYERDVISGCVNIWAPYDDTQGVLIATLNMKFIKSLEIELLED